MAKPYPWYFTIDGRPVKIVADGEASAMDPQTGAMVPVGAVSKDAYQQQLDELRQPILERYATAPLAWASTGDTDLQYRVVVDGHELVIRAGDFPDEALYMLQIDGQEVYAIDDWPAAWTKGRPPVNVCDSDGWLVHHGELPADPVDHDAEVLPNLGCTNLRCALCHANIRSVGGRSYASNSCHVDLASLYATEDLAASPQLKPSPLMRFYLCRCESHCEGNEARLNDNEGVQVATQWTCCGHPVVTLPHTFDGVQVTADNLEQLVADNMAGIVPAGARASDRDDGVWAARLCTRLANTPYTKRVVAAAATYLTHAELATRVRALCFFTCVPSRAAAMRADVLLTKHAELFVGVENPRSNISTTKTLELVIWRTAGPQLPVNAALRDLAHAFALDRLRSSEALFIALAQNDAQWFSNNAASLSAANPTLTQELLFAAGAGRLRGEVYAAIRSGVPRPQTA